MPLFSWDGAKSKANRLKHGVSFEAAKLIFDDPLHITRQNRVENGEMRWQTVGMVGNVILLVAHTWHETEKGEQIRIISARLATKSEKRMYEEKA